MLGTCELGRGPRRREKNATEGGAGRFEKPAPAARAAPPEAHASLIGRKTGAEVPLTGLSLGWGCVEPRVVGSGLALSSLQPQNNVFFTAEGRPSTENLQSVRL